MQIDLGDRTPVRGRMLISKYSAFNGKLYAVAGATVYLVSYLGTVAIVELEETGNRFPALATEIFFGTGEIAPDTTSPIKNIATPKKGKSKKAIPADNTASLF